jgi:hypothetical protein
MLTKGQKKAVTAEIQGRYIKATKKDRYRLGEGRSGTKP